MKISVLSSSRADFGIYLPLLNKLQNDSYFKLNLIVFGTHLSKAHGYTKNEILKHDFNIKYEVKTDIESSALGVTKNMGETLQSFAEIWDVEKENTDLIICLGDRYEMFAAVASSIPFNIPIAHIHGGETTLGAIDNKFRHALTQFSDIHFTSAEPHAKKVIELTGSANNVYNVGSLSLDNIDEIESLSTTQLKEQFNIDFELPTILVTFHPETVSYERNKEYSVILCETFRQLNNYQLVITLPNSDTMGDLIRDDFMKLASENRNIITVESFGIAGYFSAMRHCKFMLGNTSSGIIEAASMKKYVINLGERQKGRTAGENVINVAIDKNKILEKITQIESKGNFTGINIYQNKRKSSDQIIEILKDYYEK